MTRPTSHRGEVTRLLAQVEHGAQLLKRCGDNRVVRPLAPLLPGQQTGVNQPGRVMTVLLQSWGSRKIDVK